MTSLLRYGVVLCACRHPATLHRCWFAATLRLAAPRSGPCFGRALAHCRAPPCSAWIIARLLAPTDPAPDLPQLSAALRLPCAGISSLPRIALFCPDNSPSWLLVPTDPAPDLPQLSAALRLVLRPQPVVAFCPAVHSPGPLRLSAAFHPAAPRR